MLILLQLGKSYECDGLMYKPPGCGKNISQLLRESFFCVWIIHVGLLFDIILLSSDGLVVGSINVPFWYEHLSIYYMKLVGRLSKLSIQTGASSEA